MDVAPWCKRHCARAYLSHPRAATTNMYGGKLFTERCQRACPHRDTNTAVMSGCGPTCRQFEPNQMSVIHGKTGSRSVTLLSIIIIWVTHLRCMRMQRQGMAAMPMRCHPNKQLSAVHEPVGVTRTATGAKASYHSSHGRSEYPRRSSEPVPVLSHKLNDIDSSSLAVKSELSERGQRPEFCSAQLDNTKFSSTKFSSAIQIL
jgi:hypothetical protein